MTAEIDNRPIHPVYKIASDEMQKTSSVFEKLANDALQTEDYSEIQKFRTLGDEQLEKIPLPNVIKSTREVTGGPDNLKVKLAMFRPVGSEDDILPIIMYLHGGGFMFGSAHTHGTSATEFANGAHAVVVFVEYSLSPEAKFPVATEEIYAALCWVRENAAEINGDPEKLVVLGDSAGGNLTAVLSLMARDRGLNDAIKAQVLIYPVTSYKKDFPSCEKYGQGDYLLSVSSMDTLFKTYVPDPTKEFTDPYGVPLLLPVEKLSGLPPALVVTAECDILRDEGEAYATKLLQAGVDVVAIRVLSTIHGFMTVRGPPTPQYRQAFNVCVSFIKDIYSGKVAASTT